VRSSDEVDRIAGDLRAGLGPLVRGLRASGTAGELTMSQSSVLSVLDRDGPCTASRLAAAEGITPQSMCVIVAALLERGLVSRRPDPSDGRQMTVSATPEGIEALRGLRRERSQRLARAISEGLSAAERAQLAAAIPLLERIGRLV
jgi:DNA-binding MarR family transcriptional regulator